MPAADLRTASQALLTANPESATTCQASGTRPPPVNMDTPTSRICALWTGMCADRFGIHLPRLHMIDPWCRTPDQQSSSSGQNRATESQTTRIVRDQSAMRRGGFRMRLPGRASGVPDLRTLVQLFGMRRQEFRMHSPAMFRHYSWTIAGERPK